MHTITNILWFLILIGVMINIHEAGHYFAARWFDVKIDAFMHSQYITATRSA